MCFSILNGSKGSVLLVNILFSNVCLKSFDAFSRKLAELAGVPLAIASFLFKVGEGGLRTQR